MKKKLPIALLIMAAVLGAMGAVLFTCAAYGPASMAVPTPSPARTIAELPPPPMVLVTPTPEPSSEVQPILPPEPSFVSARTLEVDLSDPQTYYDLNLFLSNFSECYIEKMSNQATPENLEVAIQFAFYHNFWNNPETIEHGVYEQFPIEEEADWYYNMRLSKEKAARTLNYFLYNSPGLPTNAKWFPEDDHYYYSETTGGDIPGGFVLADSTDVMNDPLHILSVYFHVYDPVNYYLDDKSVYGLQPEEVDDCFGPGYYSVREGRAELIFDRKEDGTYSYKLLSFEML